jgi:DNA polymerase-3 subunit alpha
VGGIIESEESVNHSDTFPELDEFDKLQKLTLEKELLGFYLTEHPHHDKMAELKNHISHTLSELLLNPPAGQTVIVGGIIESCRTVLTKAGNQPMCFATISDLNKSVDVVVFPKVYATAPTIWAVDNVVLLSGKVESRDTGDVSEEGESISQVTILADSAAQFEGPATRLPAAPTRSYVANSAPPPKTPVTITIPSGTPAAKLVELNSLLSSNQGSQPASLIFLTENNSREISLPYGLAWSQKLEQQVSALLNSSP